MTSIKNTSQARQGLNTLSGIVQIMPGETVDVEMTNEQLARARRIPFLTINGLSQMPDPKRDEVGRELRRLQNEVTVLKARIQELEGQLSDAQAENVKLRASAGDVSTGESGTVAEVMTGLEAKHRGAGSYSVMDADGSEIVEKLTKEQAEEFNSGDDASKTAFVRAAQAAG